jgi:RNA polymerase sigma-70 factor (sigma-E family)
MKGRVTTLSHGLEETPSRTLAELYRRHAPSGRRLAYLLTGDTALAEDLVQEAFARLVGRLTHLRDPGAFDAYLRRTIVNLSKNHFRRRSVERSYLAKEAASVSGASLEPDVVAREGMRQALLALPARQRAAIVLRYYEDLPDDRIAEVLRCRPGTVRSLITRGVQQLRIDVRGESHVD